MGKLLLNLALGEPLSSVQELPCSGISIKLDSMLASALNMSVLDLINDYLFHAIMVEPGWCQLLCDL